MGPANIGTNSPLEQFKAFIASPPVIKNLVFQQKVPMGGGMRPLDGTFALSTSFEYFQARWQTNGLLFRRLNSPFDVTNFTAAGQLVSWSGHQHALFEPRPLLTTWDDRDPSVAGKSISVFYTSQFFLDPLREILNMGIMYVDIGTVRWEGNRFRVETQVDHQPLVVSGEVMPAEVGPPRCLKVRYDFPHQTHYYAVRYGYDARLQHPFFPTTITNFWLKGDIQQTEREIELDEWHVLDLETGSTPLAAGAFDVSAFTRQNKWPTRIYTNGVFYQQMTNGSLQFVETLTNQKQSPTPASRLELTGFYAAWGGLNVALFALMVGARETKKQVTTKGQKDHEVQV